MKKIIVLSLLFIIVNIYSHDEVLPEEIQILLNELESYREPKELTMLDLNDIYYQIVMHHSRWEDNFNKYSIVINYEDILKMQKHPNHNFYHYSTMVFNQDLNNKDEYFLIVTLFEGYMSFRVIFDFINNKFIYKNHALHIY
jgi:hypothetical protein